MVLGAAVACVAPSARGEVYERHQDALRARFNTEVGAVEFDPSYVRAVADRGRAMLLGGTSGTPVASEYFLLVDRNPEAQAAFVAHHDAASGTIEIIGGVRVSTGDPRRRGHYETPIGVFPNTPAHMSYRALGTRNEHGWRGLGAKGSRVWDLGWQRTARTSTDTIDIRLLLHATDPAYGESRLGKPASKGCIRIPAKLNTLLDRYGILDRAYEEDDRAKRVLPRDRVPIPDAGARIVVIDSRL